MPLRCTLRMLKVGQSAMWLGVTFLWLHFIVPSKNNYISMDFMDLQRFKNGWIYILGLYLFIGWNNHRRPWEKIILEIIKSLKGHHKHHSEHLWHIAFMFFLLLDLYLSGKYELQQKIAINHVSTSKLDSIEVLIDLYCIILSILLDLHTQYSPD